MELRIEAEVFNAPNNELTDHQKRRGRVDRGWTVTNWTDPIGRVQLDQVRLFPSRQPSHVGLVDDATRYRVISKRSCGGRR